MLTLKQVGSALMAAMFVTAITMDAADARRGGGGGGRGGGGGHRGGMHAGKIGGGGHRVGNIGGARPSHPIAGRGDRLANIGGPRPSHPISGIRPDRPGGPGRPGWGGGYWPGYGVGIGVGAIGAGLAYSSWCDPYYNNGCSGYYDTGYQDTGYQDDGVAYCAQRYRTYDVASQTYVGKGGKRIRCP